MALSIGDGKFHLDGAPVSLVGGSVHYWRLERSLWSEILDRVKEMGFHTICTYVPWSVHEIARGEFDFGEVDPAHDLDAFLSLCEEKDLHVLLRPGPHVNSEITYFGFPKRVILDPDIQSVTAEGTPVVFPSPPRMFPVPSYASEKFYREVGIFFDHVCPIIVRHLHPEGCVIAVQADNEMSFFLRFQPYDHDYSAGAVELYRTFLENKYREIARLNRIYSAGYNNSYNYSSFHDVQPPRDFEAQQKEDVPYYLDWIEYKEYYLQYGIRRIADMLRERGVVTLMYHNLPGASFNPPYNLVRMEEIVDVVGFDLYYYKEEYHKVKKGVEYLSGTSRAALLPEFASGFVALPLPIKPIMLEDAKFTTLAALMHGLAGINFYMLVERERWVGSPLDRFGGVRKQHFRFYLRLNQLLQRIDHAKLTKKSEGILLVNRDCARLELATSLLTPVPLIGNISPEQYVSEDELGFEEVIQLEYARQWNALYYGFGAAKYAVTLGDTELPAERLDRYRMVAVPVFDFLSRDVQEKLLDYVNNGGCLVTGPGVPRLDENMQMCDILGRYMHSARERVNTLTIKDMELRNVSHFDAVDTVDAAPVLEAGRDTIIYQVPVGRGRIIHFGFLFPRVGEYVPEGLVDVIDSIAEAAGLTRIIACTDPQIDVAVHVSDEREVMFLANTGKNEKEVDLGQVYIDVCSEQVVGPMIVLAPYTVRILEAISGDSVVIKGGSG